jgi:hypothetical protein
MTTSRRDAAPSVRTGEPRRHSSQTARGQDQGPAPALTLFNRGTRHPGSSHRARRAGQRRGPRRDGAPGRVGVAGRGGRAVRKPGEAGRRSPARGVQATAGGRGCRALRAGAQLDAPRSQVGRDRLNAPAGPRRRAVRGAAGAARARGLRRPDGERPRRPAAAATAAPRGPRRGAAPRPADVTAAPLRPRAPRRPRRAPAPAPRARAAARLRPRAAPNRPAPRTPVPRARPNVPRLSAPIPPAASPRSRRSTCRASRARSPTRTLPRRCRG